MSADLPCDTLLSVRNLSKSFPGQRALISVDLDVAAGEIVAVVGQNGSGKSTLVKVLSGIYEPDPGSDIRTASGDHLSHTDRNKSDTVHVIHQDLGLIPTMSTVENLALGSRDGVRVALPYSRRGEQKRARELVGRFGAEFDVTAPIGTLTAAERAIVAIARALADWEHPRQILLLDEPTAALHESEAQRLFTAVRRLAAEGAGVIFISHRLGEVLGLADRIVALRGGKVVTDVATTDIDHRELIRVIVGRDIVDDCGVGRPHPAGKPVLRVRGLRSSRVSGLDLDVYATEIVGVCGIVGSGREHIGGLVFGATPRAAGSVTVDEAIVPAGSPSAAIKHGMAFVPSDRRADGAVMTMRARENVTLVNLKPLRGRLGWLKAAAERRDAQRWLVQVELDPPLPERVLDEFSGGNQQKVVIAKWLRNLPRVLILDEPTQGVDVGARSALHSLIRNAAADGAAVLVSSSDAIELIALCDRVIVMRDGAVVTEFRSPNITEENLVHESQQVEVRPSPDRARAF